MAEFTVTRPVLESVRDNRQSWLVVQGGLRCAQIGTLCIAGGFVTAVLLTFVVSAHTNGMVGAIVAVVGGVTCLVGLALTCVGLVQCLVIPHAASRTLLLAGLLLGIYATHISTYGMFNILQAGSEDAAERIRTEIQSGQLGTVVLTSAANLLVVGSLLSLAAFLGSESGIKRVHALWKLQFGGSAILVALTLSFGALDWQFVAPILTLALTTFFVAGVLWFQSTVLGGVRSDLGQVIDYHDQKLAAAMSKQKAAEA